MRNGERALSSTITSLHSALIASKSSSKERASSTCPENSNSWRIQQLIGELYIIFLSTMETQELPQPQRAPTNRSRTARDAVTKAPLKKRGPQSKPIHLRKKPVFPASGKRRHNYSWETKLAVLNWTEDRASWKPCWLYNRIRKGQVFEGNWRPPTDAEASFVCAVPKTMISTWWKNTEAILAAPKGSFHCKPRAKEGQGACQENQGAGQGDQGDDQEGQSDEEASQSDSLANNVSIPTSHTSSDQHGHSSVGVSIQR
jgi:hypothetical protein